MSQNFFTALHARFSETISFVPKRHETKRSRSVRTAQLEENGWHFKTQRPEKNTKELSLQFSISNKTVWNNIQYEQQLHPYCSKSSIPFVRRFPSSRIVLPVFYLEVGLNFLAKVLFAGEDGGWSSTRIEDLLNSHIWADENPHDIMINFCYFNPKYKSSIMFSNIIITV